MVKWLSALLRDEGSGVRAQVSLLIKQEIGYFLFPSRDMAEIK